MPAAKPLMLMKKRGHTCLIASSMVSLVLLMLVLYGTFGTQQAGSSILRYDYQLLGRPLYKLDLSWPKNPELFTGEGFGVAVNQYAGVVYVAQRGNNMHELYQFIKFEQISILLCFVCVLGNVVFFLF